MKTSNTSNLNSRKLVASTLLLIATSFLLSMTLSNNPIFRYQPPTGIALPDTIPPDSTGINDTISVTGVINVTDTTEILTISLDSIFLLSEDTTVYIAQYDSTVSYYIGDTVGSVLFEKPVDTAADSS